MPVRGQRGERPGNLAAVTGVAQDDLAAIRSVALTPEVTGLDHGLNQVGNRGDGGTRRGLGTVPVNLAADV
jgi:hypothetical protein